MQPPMLKAQRGAAALHVEHLPQAMTGAILLDQGPAADGRKPIQQGTQIIVAPKSLGICDEFIDSARVNGGAR